MSTDAAESARHARAATLPPGEQSPLVEAADLEVVLPSGDGVGPWSGTIQPGEQILLLGPSGSGKSTFLLALAGAIPAHVRATIRGTVRVAGKDPTRAGVAGLSGTVGYLGQDPVSGVCLPHVADEVALPLENRAVPPNRIGERVASALAAVGAQGLAEREAVSLSGGQLQRVALAANIVAAPGLLLLDEPTAMLDAEGVAAVRSSIVSACNRPGVASMLVEHRLDDWAGERGIPGLPSRTIALDRSGRILADGPTMQVLAEHGRTLRAAGCWLPREVDQRLDREERVQAPTAVRRVTSAREAAPRRKGREPGEVALRARGLAVGHDGVSVLRDVDLDVRAGQVLAVVGRNGAGKSTLLGALARLDEPVAGTITGEAAALVFQRPESQFVGVTVRQELAETGAGAEQVEAMIERLGLAPWAEASPFRLSGGQQRRLSLGVMLLGDRPVLLADEPGFGLDRSAHRTMAQMLRDAAEAGRAVVMTTHDARALTFADAVAVIAEGEVRTVCSPQELLADPDLLSAAGLSAGGADGPADHTAEEITDRSAVAPGAVEDGEAARTEQMHGSARAPRGTRSSKNGSRCAESGGWLSARNPTVLLGLLTALSIVCLFLTDPLPLGALYLLLIAAVVAGTRIGPLQLLRVQIPFALFALGIMLVNMLSRPGRALWPEAPIRITEEGIVLGAALALRALVIGLGAITVTRATDSRSTMVSLQQHARLPARYALALLAGRRLLDELPRRWHTLTRAHRVRLPLRKDGTVPPLGPRRMLRCAFSLLVDAIRSAERIAFALESRGLTDGPRTVYRPVGLDRSDLLTVVVSAMTVTAVLVVL